MTEIDHVNRRSAADSESNRNPRRDKHLRARDFHDPRQCLLSGQGSTVTFGTENKGTPGVASRTKDAPDSQRVALARKVCGMLKVPSKSRRRPSIRRRLRKGSTSTWLIDEADVEHTSAKELIAKIESSGPTGQYYDAPVKVRATS